MSYNKKAFCKRCLLEETGQSELIRSLEELKAALPEQEKIEEGEYLRRLSICRQCDSLYDGTCSKCGCYVEFRALKKKMCCPHENKKW